MCAGTRAGAECTWSTLDNGLNDADRLFATPDLPGDSITMGVDFF